MRNMSERIGWTLTAISLSINILLAVAHMGFLGERLNMQQTTHQAVVAGVPGSTEADLVSALTFICTEHGIADRAGSKGKVTLFPTCPLCLFFAMTTLVLAFGQLFLVLRRKAIGHLLPLAATRRLSEFLQRLAQPRGPPAFRIAN